MLDQKMLYSALVTKFFLLSTANMRNQWFTIVFSLQMQAQQNSEFIQRKRDEVSFSPEDQSSVDSFLQVSFSSLYTVFFMQE